MKALIPDGHGSVVMSHVDQPTAGEHEVVVAVEAFSVNRGETFLLERPRPGWRPGKDVAGTVLRAATAGCGPGVGERVVAHPASGGWAEQVAVPLAQLARLPRDVAFTEAAALPLAGLTALRLLRVAGSLAGRRVLLTGASGGVGHYFVQLAAAQGAAITAVTSTALRGARLSEFGAVEVVCDIEHAQGPYDVVIESVGGEVFPLAWRRLTPRGRFVWMGQASRQAPTLDFFDWSGGASATLRKFDCSDSDINDGDDLATLVRLASRGRLHSQLDRVEDWGQTPALLEALLAHQIRGKAILEVTR